MPDSIRPDLIIEQRFVTQTPLVISTPLNVLYFGIQRQQVWQGDAGDYVGGQANPAYEFPELNPGADVEQPSAPEAVLHPHVYLQNRFGIAEVAPTYNWAVDPPVFTLSPSLSATFEVSEGTTGQYSATTGRFIDGNADFIEDEVAAGDVIKINGVESLDVVSLISDDEIEVLKVDKGPGTYSGDLSATDINGDRTLTDLAFDFAAVTKVGDIVSVVGWDLLSQADGIDYSVETLGVRTLTGTAYDFVAAGLSGPVVGPLSTIDIVWIQDSSLDWTPAFFVTGTAITTTTAEIQNLITAWPTPTGAEDNKIFEIYRYIQTDLGTGILVPPPLDVDDTTGGYTLPVAGVRTFSHTQLAGVIDFTVMLPALPPPLSRYSIAFADAFGVMRPIFKFAPVTAETQTTVQVVDWDPNRPGSVSASPNILTWELWDDGGAPLPLLTFLGASVSAENPLDSNKRTLNSTYNTFITDLVTPGAVIYSDTGVALFLVTDVLLETQLKCVNIVPGSPASGWSSTEFGFTIMDDTPADLTVTRIISDTAIGVRNVLADPPATAFTDLSYAITVANVLSDANYTIEKTLTGSGLTGTVLCSYMARRNDRLGFPVEVTSDNREELVGQANPANPLGLGAFLALQNTPYTVWCGQVEEDTVAAWLEALESAKSSSYYILCPLTQNETVLAAFRTHTLQQSTPDIKRERILFQNHLFERIEDRTEDQPGDTGLYTKTPSTTTITVARDLSAYGVIVGDVFAGLAPAFEARIITIVSGATTTLTVVNDNGLPIGGPTPITDWEIRSKDLTDAEFAANIAAYATSIKERRIRNVYPDRCEVTFTDDTDPSNVSGFYGGGDVTEEVGGQFLAAIEAAKRSGQKPGQPLSRFNGAGIHKLINPFGDPEGGDEDLNDVVLNGGNWLMSQPSDDAGVFAIRAVTTDVSSIYYLEDHVTVQVDYFARKLRTQIKPLLGPFNIEEAFFDIISANVEAVRIKVLNERNAREIEFLSIREDETQADQFLLDFNFTPFVTGAKAKVTIYI